MDLATRMYVGYAVSVISEMGAYRKGLEIIGMMRIDL
jgi:transposase